MDTATSSFGGFVVLSDTIEDDLEYLGVRTMDVEGTTLQWHYIHSTLRFQKALLSSLATQAFTVRHQPWSNKWPIYSTKTPT